MPKVLFFLQWKPVELKEGTGLLVFFYGRLTSALTSKLPTSLFAPNNLSATHLSVFVLSFFLSGYMVYTLKFFNAKNLLLFSGCEHEIQ